MVCINWKAKAALCVALSVSFMGASHARESASEAKAVVVTQVPAQDIGLWVWPRSVVQHEEERDALLTFCKKNSITRLLVQIHFNKAVNPPQLAYPEEMRDLLAKAKALGIAVEALDGAPEMGLEVERARTMQYLDAVLTFNKQMPTGEGFAGIHYDIEPHLSKRWRDGDVKGVSAETLVTMKEIQDRIRAADPSLLIAYDIPMWFDARGDDLAIEFNGSTKNLHEHIQDLSDYVGIMSYRTYATGKNSVEDVCAQELAYAQKTGKKLYASLETGQLKDEPTITFYGHPKEEFFVVRDGVLKSMSASPAFGGVLLHHYGAVRDLVEGTKTIPEKE